jgi:hypothetical protein
MKSIQNMSIKGNGESVAFVMFNVKGRDLLAIDEMTENEDDLNEKISGIASGRILFYAYTGCCHVYVLLSLRAQHEYV